MPWLERMALAGPTRLASKTDALLCSVIANPLIRAIARLCPSARFGFFALRKPRSAVEPDIPAVLWAVLRYSRQAVTVLIRR